jgi:peptidoglycan hydrolase-like protein with peptidoglycan-binding domain
MALRSPFWNTNARLQKAADNNPAMHQFEPNKAAVILLQQALVNTGMAIIKVDGAYGPKTAAGVRAVQTRFNMEADQGVAGRQTLGILDILLQNGHLGADLARTDIPLAGVKVGAAVRALNNFKLSQTAGTAANAVTVNALQTHFRLTVAPSTIGVTRQITNVDVDFMTSRYGQLVAHFAANAVSFSTGVPVNGILTAAEAPVGGPVRFGPAFTDVNSHFGDKIGPNSRAAILIHESVHVFDAISGINNDTHISEFDPAYNSQPADRALHNPSSFAGFAAHVHKGSDPSPRFGLGPGSRGL